MAQEYYSFMMNRFFETLFIQLMANVLGNIWMFNSLIKSYHVMEKEISTLK